MTVNKQEPFDETCIYELHVQSSVPCVEQFYLKFTIYKERLLVNFANLISACPFHIYPKADFVTWLRSVIASSPVSKLYGTAHVT